MRPYMALPVEQAVTALSVRVVGDQVENSHAPQGFVVAGFFEEAEIVLLDQRVHAILKRAGPRGASRRAAVGGTRSSQPRPKPAHKRPPPASTSRGESPTRAAHPWSVCIWPAWSSHRHRLRGRFSPGPLCGFAFAPVFPPEGCTATRKVAFELHRSRPLSSISPEESNRSTASESSGRRKPVNGPLSCFACFACRVLTVPAPGVHLS